MPLSSMPLSRRKMLLGTAAITGVGMPLSSCDKPVSSGPNVATDNNVSYNVKTAEALLKDATGFLLESYPETASSFGIDNGDYEALKSKLADRSEAGQVKISNDLNNILLRFEALDAAKLPADQALNIDVIRTVFERAKEGFGFDFGDNALLNYNWSYRNSPYVVTQNTGAFTEIPGFLEGSHVIETKDDAESYLMRLSAYAQQLDGETERTRKASEKGYILPDFLMEKTLGQLRNARSQAPETWGLVTAFAAKTAQFGESYKTRAENIARDIIGPALDRQIKVHADFAASTNSDAGIWAKPEGEAYYDWALRAGTTTNLSPDGVHEMGRDELAALQGQMDPILRSLGYRDGPVGARMTALAKDKRYHFADGDKGRAEIMDYIDGKIEEIRGLMPQAFETLVPGLAGLY